MNATKNTTIENLTVNEKGVVSFEPLQGINFYQWQLIRVYTERNEYITGDYTKDTSLDLFSRQTPFENGNYEILVAAVIDEKNSQTGNNSVLQFHFENGNLISGFKTETPEPEPKVNTQEIETSETETRETQTEEPNPETNNQNQVDILNKEAGPKPSQTVPLTGLRIHPEGKQIVWDSIPGNNYRLRLVVKNGSRSIMIQDVPDRDVTYNGVRFGNLTEETYQLSVAGYNSNGERGPWSSIIFHLQDGKYIEGRLPRRQVKPQQQEVQVPAEKLAPQQNPPAPPTQPTAEKLLEFDKLVEEKLEATRKEAEKKAVELERKNAELEKTLEQTITRTLEEAQRREVERKQRDKESYDATIVAQQAAAALKQEREKASKDLKDQQEKARQNQRELAAKIQELKEQLEKEKKQKEEPTAPVPPPAAPVPPPAAVPNAVGQTPAAVQTPQQAPVVRPWYKEWCNYAIAACLLVAALLGYWLINTNKTAKPVGANTLAQNQGLDELKNLIQKTQADTAAQIAALKAGKTADHTNSITPPKSTSETKEKAWMNSPGSYRKSGNTIDGDNHGVINYGEIKNSKITINSSEVWTSEWRPTLPTVTCGKEMPAGTNEFVMGPREVQCILVPLGWNLKPCLEDLINFDMMCGDETIARNYLSGNAGQPPITVNQMRFRLKGHITEETRIRFKVTAP